MTKHLAILAVVYGAFVLEGTGVLRVVPPSGLSPLLLCLMVPIWHCSAASAVVWGGVIGLLADSLSSGTLGVDMLLASTLTFFAVRLRESWMLRSSIAWFCVALLVLSAMHFASAGLHGLLDHTFYA